MALDSLGDRMKANYENRFRSYLPRRMPVIVRVDGVAFHTLTRGMTKPFDTNLMNVMTEATMATARHMSGFRLGYVASDEASFLLSDHKELTTEAWFDNNLQKVVSVAAGRMTAAFNRRWQHRSLAPLDSACFDGRAFVLPVAEVANYFLWRARDWQRNSVAMYAQANFSPRQLHGKGVPEQHELLHTIGKNWTTDMSARERNGTFITPDYFETSDVLPNFADIDALISRAYPEGAPAAPAAPAPAASDGAQP